MEIKKEFQQTILGAPQSNEKASDEEFYSVLRAIAPGTNIRTALNGILKADKGAIIVVENEWVNLISDGGFKINARFTPQRLIELSKMDGAMILSRDMKRIILANALLTPDSKIPTNETGTRHKAAERTSKQAGTLVIAISERRHEITIYYKNIRYTLTDSSELLRKANEYIQMIEKQRELFDKSIEKLNVLELKGHPSLNQAAQVIQKGRIIQKISSDLQKYILELGREGTLLKTRLKEITTDIDKETDLVIKDYTLIDMKKSKILFEELAYEDLLDKDNILNVLAYETPILRSPVKGWRILSKTSLQESEIASLLKEAGSLAEVLHSSIELFKTVFEEEKAKNLKIELENLKFSMNV